MTWKLLSTDEYPGAVVALTTGRWEYWTDGADVYRRRVSDFNYCDADGAPVGARWESTLTHFERTHAPKPEWKDPYPVGCEYLALGLDDCGI